MHSRDEIYDFISSKLLMVLSTVSQEGKPQSAVVGFGQTDKFELIFGTSKLSRKAQNILKNSAVSVIIGWDDEGTVQLEGTARMLEADEAKAYAEVYFQKNPKSRQYKKRP